MDHVRLGPILPFFLLIKHQCFIFSYLSCLWGSLNKLLFGLSGEGLFACLLLFPLLGSVGESLEVVFVLAIACKDQN